MCDALIPGEVIMILNVFMCQSSVFPLVKWAPMLPFSQDIIISCPLYLALWSGQGRAASSPLSPPPFCSRRFGHANTSPAGSQAVGNTCLVKAARTPWALGNPRTTGCAPRSPCGSPTVAQAPNPHDRTYPPSPLFALLNVSWTGPGQLCHNQLGS